MFLGIDCSGVMAELALVAGDLTWTAREDTPRQADVVFSLLEKILSDAGADKNDLRAIGAITGPGSFTGIRVGLALAQGLADGLGISAFGLDAFTAMNADGIIALESKRDELYVRHSGKVEMLFPAQILQLSGTITHNTQHQSLGTPKETSMAIAAAQHAEKCFHEKRTGEMLSPYYVREADAKPAA